MEWSMLFDSHMPRRLTTPSDDFSTCRCNVVVSQHQTASCVVDCSARMC